MALVMGHNATHWLYKFCSFVLIGTFLLGDSYVFLERGLYRAPTVAAAVGDFSIFREAVGTEAVTSTAFDVTWDTVVQEASDIALDVNGADIALDDGGKYFVTYNVWTEEGSAGGTNRRSVATYLTLDGSVSPYGWGGGYIRDAENDLTAYNSGAAIIDATAGQNLRVVAQRDDTNSGASTAIRPGTNGISVLKLDDSLDYLRVYRNTRSADISANTTFTDVIWEVADEVDTGSFGFTPTSADITVKGSTDQLFLVTANVKLNVDAGSGPRQNYEMRLTLDGTEVPGTRTSSYLRFDDGTINGTMQYVGIIKKTSASDQTFNIEVRNEGQASASTDIVANETALSMVALPGSAKVLSLTNTADQLLTSSQSTLAWDEQIVTDANYTHSTTTNNDDVEIAVGGNYLFFATTYTSRTSGTGRDVPRIDWRVDGSVQNYGGHGSFNRGDQGAEDTYTSGASSAVIFPNLLTGEVVELLQSDETTGTPNANFIADRVALQAVEISSLLAPATTEVSVSGTQPTTIGPSTADVVLGEVFVITELDSARNVTNVTLSETGSVSADTGLDAIRLYYDLDTSVPYDCASESYGGNEAQFGATSTFSGIDGTVSFTSSETISPTQAMCLYTVFDVTSSTTDGQTINIVLDNPSVDVVVTGGGTVNPPSTLGTSFTTIVDAEITQTNYHWRNDDGTETGATSATGGSENMPGLAFDTISAQRLRIGVAGAGTGSETNQYRLEYTEKAETCDAVASWADVGAVGGAWDMFDSPFVAEAADTTNIAIASGGVTDEANEFIAPNGGVRDVTSQTGSITINNTATGTIAEFGNTTVTNGALTTINLTESFYDPVVVASVRYDRTAIQRTPRIDNKASSSFDILIDNYDGTLTGTTNIDYIVFEAGDWLVDDGGTGTRVYAGSTNTSVVAGRSLPADPGGPTVTYPTGFPAEPAVISTVVTRNDPAWVFSSVYQGTSITNPPGTTNMRLFLNDNFDSDGHGAVETIDYIVFEQGHDTSNGVAFDAVTTGAATVSNTPTAVNYDTAYGATPAVILAQALTQNGSDGGYAQIDTNTAPTASAVTVSSDEEGESSIGELADRTHAAEEVAVVSFASGGTFEGIRADLSQFVELEYAVRATGAAIEGQAYCFRVSDAGTALRNYNTYPEATLSADVTVTANGSQISTINADTTETYLGGQFAITSNGASHTLTDVTITETGTIDAAAHLLNPVIAYDLDTSLPFDCASESYDGTEMTLSGSSFTDPNGTSSITTSLTVSPTQAVCLYVVSDVGSAANGETIDIEISTPNNDVILSTGTVGPGSVVALSGSTTVQAGSLTQANYQWRNDDGTETGATSATGGVENTLVGPVFQSTIQRLRFAVSNEGNAIKSTTGLRLEYGTKVTTCADVGSWERIDTGVAFEMASTSQLVEGNNTTNIALGLGGVSDPNTTFITSNGGQLEEVDQLGAITITTSEYLELEYALRLTEVSGFGATYCFRLTDAGTALDTYSNYPELTVQDRQDFFVQRGTEVVTGSVLTLTAGVDYIAPSSNTSAYVRITDTNMTGAGSLTLGQTRSPNDLFAYIEGADNLTSSFSIVRPPGAGDNTRVQWEIVEYIGVAGADNEFIVRDAGEVTYGTASLFATGTPVVGVTNDTNVAVFITGQYNPDGSTANYNTGLSISSWDASGDQPVFERGDADGVAARASYAVVEFTGASWNVQRAEHTFAAAGVTETETITAVNSLLRTFVHAQKLSGDELFNLDESGHEVWLSSIGAVSFQLENGSTNPGSQRSVAWVIENTQTGAGSMAVYRSNGLIAATTTQPTSYLFSIGATVQPSNASMWATTRSTGAGSAHPRAQLGARVFDETQFELWKSDEGQNQNFRVEVVEWPVAETSIRQTHYRFYVDNDGLTPTDPWPIGVADLGENTSMTDLDEPLGEGERTRIRMGLFVNNASLVTDSVSFKLQYARRVTTCAAVDSWNDVGAAGSGSIWRSFDGTPVDGTELLGDGALLLSTSNVAGTYEENNPSVVNPNSVEIGEYIEYDWVIENNAALQKTSYCFRMTEDDGTVIDGYDVYPTVRTSGYTPIINNWRWFTDESSLTPSSPAAAENVAPSAVGNGEELKLRVSVTEVEGAPGENIKFNLQYSEYADFRDAVTLNATTSCDGNDLWCYADGAGDDGGVLPSTVLTGVDSCVAGVGDGCGTRNEAEGLSGTYDQPAFATSEHEFTLRHDGARVNAVYYFRLYDATNGVPLLASSSYPSLTTEGAILTFSVSGVDAQTATEGIITSATTTATKVDFGSLPIDADIDAAQRLTVFMNGTQGYRVYMNVSQDPTDSYGNTIPSVTATNAVPATWASVCTGAATGCFGYHVGDNSLYDGSVRFALDDTFAGVESGPVEIMSSNVPVTFDVNDVVYRARVSFFQPAGQYNSSTQYIVVPIF